MRNLPGVRLRVATLLIGLVACAGCFAPADGTPSVSWPIPSVDCPGDAYEGPSERDVSKGPSGALYVRAPRNALTIRPGQQGQLTFVAEVCRDTPARTLTFGYGAHGMSPDLAVAIPNPIKVAQDATSTHVTITIGAPANHAPGTWTLLLNLETAGFRPVSVEGQQIRVESQ